MRLDVKSFEILRYLGFHRPLTELPGMMKGKFGFASYSQDDTAELNNVLRYFYLHWDEVSRAFSDRVELLSQSFCNEEMLARHTLSDYVSDKRPEVLGGVELQGTILVPHLKMSLSYYLPFDAYGMLIVDRMAIFQLSQGNAVSLAVFPNKESGTRTAFVSSQMKTVDFTVGSEVDVPDEFSKELDYLDIMVSTVINHYLFRRYANVKTKIVARDGTREAKKANPDRDYISSLDFPIRQLDATYFTTTIHSGAFLRRGHFRMQRYKNNGEWDHKLIWIDQMTISGYTRKARVLVDPALENE